MLALGDVISMCRQFVGLGRKCRRGSVGRNLVIMLMASNLDLLR